MKMPDEKKHIDKLFRDRLYNHSTVPSGNLWTALEARLDRVIALRNRRYFLRIAAALLLLLGSGGLVMLFLSQDTDSNLLPREIQTVSESLKVNDYSPSAVPLPEPDKYSVTEYQSASPAGVFEKEKPEKFVKEPLLPGLLNPYTTDRLISGFHSPKLKKGSGKAGVEIDTPVSQGYTHQGRWIAGIMAAPNYSYRTIFSGQSGYLEILTFNNSERGLLSFSGSLNIRYEFNERLSLQSGLDITKMGQSIGGIQVEMDPSSREPISEEGQKRSISTPQPVFNSYGDISISAATVTVTDMFLRFSDGSVGAIPGAIFPDQILNQGTIIQSLYYVQVPLLLRYRVITGDTGLALSGGLGGNLLAGNRVTLRHLEETYQVGQTLNLNRFGLSGILAISFEQKIGNNISLIVEPRLNHFITPVNTEGNHLSMPYAVSFFGGITYRF